MILGSIVYVAVVGAMWLGVGYICYWCFRGARYTWATLNGRSVVKSPSALSPRAAKAFHVVATLASIVTVVVVGTLYVALSSMEF